MVKGIVDDNGEQVTLFSPWFEERAQRNMIREVGVGAQAQITRILFNDGRHTSPLVEGLALCGAKAPLSGTVDARIHQDAEEKIKSLELEIGSCISKYERLQKETEKERALMLKEKEAERRGKEQALTKNAELAKRVSVVSEEKRSLRSELKRAKTTIAGLTAQQQTKDDTYRRKLAEVEGELVSTQTELMESRDKGERFQAECARLTQSRNDLQANGKRSIDELQVKLTEADDSLLIQQGTEDALRAQLRAQTNKNSAERDAFESCHSKLQLAFAEAQETVNMQSEEIRMLKDRAVMRENQTRDSMLTSSEATGTMRMQEQQCATQCAVTDLSDFSQSGCSTDDCNLASLMTDSFTAFRTRYLDEQLKLREQQKMQQSCWDNYKYSNDRPKIICETKKIRRRQHELRCSFKVLLEHIQESMSVF